jgi:hypothetical protein
MQLDLIEVMNRHQVRSGLQLTPVVRNRLC